MSKDLRQAFQEMQGDLAAVKARLGDVEARLGDVEARLGDVEARLGDVEARLASAEESLRQAHEGIRQAHRGIADINRTFSNFVARFDEVGEMLVSHDTEQLQRLAAIEDAQADLRQKWQDLAGRVEALEKGAPPAA